ncbi:penicillin-binding protein, 1A family [Hyphomicrobium denitrificans ATCC 51888]|uniref:Penicillin-binding protein, 1A family n=1 Tax=Hyphomicrobium denitrificans (strain ATCC 51888 / DSM 1869 / NCIMB 11706 / TK 0415) TaxID=582899 RepID=D8JVM8_HYPDA|nr:PBP1A family penicillin-binding protein [Hyphomicrobium denitrificans]ADJ22917.1 penicillin-binding protein, 1A family [Hyphomicrobium denitrificans ATCC 51888]
MNDWFFRQGGRDRFINWLALDSKLNSTLGEAWSRIKDYWNAGSSYFARFQLVGWRRLLNEFASEGLTMMFGGLVVLYGLALPAFQEFDESKFLTGKFAVTFLDVNGNEIGKRGILHNDAVPLDQIPDVLIKATLSTEDRRFFEHYGIDVLGTMRALLTNVQANEVVQGGSTLTQQLAKNLFLSSERSLQRKIKELFLAFLLESRYTKRQILKLYFDRAYMGGGTFGVEAASQYYFGKSVRDITMAEAAMLAGLFKAPSKYSPLVDLAASRARTNQVLDNLVEAGYYTAGQVHAARMSPARVAENRTSTSPDWFLDWAYEEVQRLAEGKDQYVLTARTTVDLTLQRQAEEALNATLKRNGRSDHFNSGAIVVMETDGKVRAIVGGPDYGESQFNRATRAKRQPGSSFKVYVYAAALENGYKPDTMVRDASRSCGNWSPSNYGGGGGSGGRLPLWQALAKSLNTVATELSFAVGREKVIEMTKRLGIEGVKKTCSMALGDGGITVLEHTGGFATFANGGKRAKPYGILDITTSKGDLLYSRERDEPPAEQVVSRQVAEGMNTMLYRVVNEGTGGMANLDFTNVAGKTGTSTGPKDAWFMGFTGKYVAGVWIGNDDNHAMRMGVTGGHQAAPVWHDLMTVAHADMNIPTIPGLQPHPRQIEEQQRLAAIKAAQVAAGLEPATKDETGKPETIMSEKTRAVLKSLTTALRKAEGGPGDPATPPPSNAPQDPKDPKTPERADRRATLFDSYSGEPGASGAQRAQ